MGLKEMGSGTNAAVWVVGDQAGDEASSRVVSRCPAGGTSCADLTGGIPSSSTLWSSIDGYTDGSGVEHVFLGAFKGASSGYHVPVYRIDRTSDGSVTRSPLPASSAGVHNNVNGSGGPQWWVINQDLPEPAPPNTSNPSDRMGYGTYQTSQLVLDPSSTGAAGNVRLIAAGRAGAWRSGNAARRQRCGCAASICFAAGSRSPSRCRT